ncbi:MAG TPA: hypothetical protein VI488_16430 [Candidatus Angelobacter sp.]
MPASYVIDKQKRLVVTCAWGACTADDALEFRRQILSDSNFDPTFAQLADFTAVTTIDITPGEVRMLAWVNPFSPDSRRAIVVTNPLAFGLARIFETLRSLRGDRHIRVFRDRQEALAWIFLKDEAA